MSLRDWLVNRTESERATLARLWALRDASGGDAETLANAMLRGNAVERVLHTLGPRERAALKTVQQHGGQIAAPILEREFGGLRAINDYPNPRAYLLSLKQPPTPTERLWALALIAPYGEGARRVYAIPNDLQPFLPPTPAHDRALRLAPTSAPPEIAPDELNQTEQALLMVLTLAQDGLLEVIPTGGLNKASLKRLAQQWSPGEKLDGVSREEHWPYIHFVRTVGEGAGLLRIGTDSLLRPTRAALEWLQQSPFERTRALLDGWVASRWDELTAFVGIKVQRDYFRDVPTGKRAILRLVAQAPANEWVRFDEFVAEVRRAEPDFARPDGRYDTWGLVSYTRQPLDGFVFWDEVEGEQLRSIAGGTLRWLGLTDLGMDREEPISFRLTPFGAALLERGPIPDEPPVEPLVAQPNFEVIAPPFASPYARFQLRRIAERTSTGNENKAETYRLSKRSIQTALERGIPLDDLLRFLAEYSARDVPQNVAASLREWAGQHGQVAMRPAMLLETQDAVLLEQIRRDKRVRVPQIEELSATVWSVRPGDAAALATRLRKAGYGLTEDGTTDKAPLSEHDLTILFSALEFYAHACAELGVDSDASGAMRQRVARLLPEHALNRAYQASRSVFKRLKVQLNQNKEQRTDNKASTSID